MPYTPLLLVMHQQYRPTPLIQTSRDTGYVSGWQGFQITWYETPASEKKNHVIERGVGCVIMGVMWWILTYDVNFILKLFTNHLCLYVISLQVIINQRVLANPVKYNFVWRVKSLTMPIDCWCRHLAKSKFQVAKFSPGERIIF